MTQQERKKHTNKHFSTVPRSEGLFFLFVQSLLPTFQNHQKGKYNDLNERRGKKRVNGKKGGKYFSQRRSGKKRQ
jgi:hypothetical protein